MSRARPDFDIDLKKGQLRERAVARLLMAIAGDDVEVMRFEVKSQVKSRTHLFIESSDAGRPSGLFATSADYWLIEITEDDRWILISTGTLRRLYRKALAAFGYSRGGDNGEAQGVSIPKTWFVD